MLECTCSVQLANTNVNAATNVIVVIASAAKAANAQPTINAATTALVQKTHAATKSVVQRRNAANAASAATAL